MAFEGEREPRSFHDKHLFRVKFRGFGYSGWQKCSALEAELAKIEHWEGGRMVAHKSPGRLTISDFTLERGVTSDQDMFAWFEETANAVSEVGAVDADFRRDGDIYVLARDQRPAIRIPLYDCFISKFTIGDFDNTVDEKLMTSMTVVPTKFGRPLILR